MDYAKLTADLKKAKDHAISIGMADNDDGGTCNFDTPVLVVKGARLDFLKKAAELAGVNISRWESGYYHIYGDFLWGQGFLRTRMAEAFAKSLKDSGWDTYVYYAMD